MLAASRLRASAELSRATSHYKARLAWRRVEPAQKLASGLPSRTEITRVGAIENLPSSEPPCDGDFAFVPLVRSVRLAQQLFQLALHAPVGDPSYPLRPLQDDLAQGGRCLAVSCGDRSPSAFLLYWA